MVTYDVDQIVAILYVYITKMYVITFKFACILTEISFKGLYNLLKMIINSQYYSFTIWLIYIKNIILS